MLWGCLAASFWFSYEVYGQIRVPKAVQEPPEAGQGALEQVKRSHKKTREPLMLQGAHQTDQGAL